MLLPVLTVIGFAMSQPFAANADNPLDGLVSEIT
jgi:hypothetical protein